MINLYPVILAGGYGTRLWPLSRKSFPKQFNRIFGEKTLYQSTAIRMTGTFEKIKFQSPLIMTNSDFRFLVIEQLHEIGINPSTIIIEPRMRSTAPPILVAALKLIKQNPDAIMIVAPSDHVIDDEALFKKAIYSGVEVAQNGQLVTFGIKPKGPETGYGYLELENNPEKLNGPIKLKSFVEKPNLNNARNMFQNKKFLWNSGIFLFKAKDIISAFRELKPNLFKIVSASFSNATTDLNFLRLSKTDWDQVENISIDYAIMEKAKNLSVIPFNGSWSDLGSWNAVHDICKEEENSVVTHGNVTALDCKNVLLRSENESMELVGLGLRNLIAIAMKDAVLVADISESQNLKKTVETLKAKNTRQAETSLIDYRPWGHFEILSISKNYQIKQIVVKPGASLSLQSHKYRSEHWVLIEGKAKVTINKKISIINKNESVFVPVGATHRLENPGKENVVLIEIQTGSYLGEDDITRYDDAYNRT